MKKTTRRAFTLTECLIALSIGLVVWAGIWQLLRSGVTFLTRSESRMDPRSQALLAMTRVRQALMDASEVSVDGTGSSVRFRSSRGEGEIRHDAATSELHIRTGSGDHVSRGIRSFTLAATGPGLVHVALGITRPATGGKTPTLDPLALEDDVFIPVLGRRNDNVPWRFPQGS